MNGKPWISESNRIIGLDWDTTDGGMLRIDLYPDGSMAWMTLEKQGEPPYPFARGVAQTSPLLLEVLSKFGNDGKGGHVIKKPSGDVGVPWATSEPGLASISIRPDGTATWWALNADGRESSGEAMLAPEVYRLLAKLADARGEWTAPAKTTEDEPCSDG